MVETRGAHEDRFYPVAERLLGILGATFDRGEELGQLLPHGGSNGGGGRIGLVAPHGQVDERVAAAQA